MKIKINNVILIKKESNMLNLLIKWILLALSIMFVAWLIPGITISGFTSALIVVLIMGLVNAFIRPIVELISLPLNVLTLGIFSLIINTLLFLLIARFSPGFQIDGFWNGFFGAILLSFITPLVDKIGKNKKY